MKFDIGTMVAALAVAAFTMTTQVHANEESVVAPVSVAVDGDAAESLARREGCLKCHGATKDKEGPSFRKVASKFNGKFKDKAEAEDKVLKHMRAGGLVKFSDGEEEEHRILRSQDESAVMNLVRWILSR